MSTRIKRLICVGVVVGAGVMTSAAWLQPYDFNMPPWRVGSAHAGPDHPGDGHDHPAPGATGPAKAPHAHDAKQGEGAHAGHGHDEGKHGEGAGGAGAHAADHAADEGLIRMSPAQMTENHIGLATAAPGVLALTLTAPGVIAPDSDRISRIAARVIGTVAVLNKRLGDLVKEGDIVAELDSREAADARSEYFSAITNLDLQKTLFAREQELWNRRVSAEQQFLRARNTLSEVQLRVDLAAQKLAVLGLSRMEVTAARGDSALAAEAMQRYPIRAPMSGRVVERRVDRGAPVGGEGQEKELYVIADLSKVWAELAIPSDELPRIVENQHVRLLLQDGTAGVGRIIFISPMLNTETRSARVIAEVDNEAMRWRPGAHVTAQIITAEEPVALRIPRDAIQSVNGRPAVFVRTAEGFRLRAVTSGRDDGVHVAITSGLAAGETVAASNTFLLKAELGKDEASHAH